MANVRDEFEAALRAQRVAAHRRLASDDGQEFYELMKDEWSSVDYNPTTGKGQARAGTLGVIRWSSSGNDPAVVVTIDKFPRIKASADIAAKALDEIRAIVNKYSD